MTTVPKQPPTFTSPSLLTNSRSRRALSLAGSLTSWVRKLSSTHCRNFLDCFFSAAIHFQQTSSKLKCPMRTSNSDYGTSPSCLQTIFYICMFIVSPSALQLFHLCVSNAFVVTLWAGHRVVDVPHESYDFFQSLLLGIIPLFLVCWRNV